MSNQKNWFWQIEHLMMSGEWLIWARSYKGCSGPKSARSSAHQHFRRKYGTGIRAWRKRFGFTSKQLRVVVVEQITLGV